MLSIYIAEFSRPDADNESIWFVGASDASYIEQLELALQQIALDYYDGDIQDAREWVAIEGVYTVPIEMITKVYKSQAVQ